MKEYHIGQTVVPYEVSWSPDRETIGLSLDESLELTVRAPMTATHGDIEKVLDKRQEWLLGKLYDLKEQANPPYTKEFLSGEKLQYRGRDHRLNVIEANVSEPVISFDGHEFTMRTHRFDAPGDSVSVRRKRQAVVDWYVRRAGEELPDRTLRFESKLGLDNTQIEVCEVDGRWGEYDEGTVRLNWRLILAPASIQDYVVVHELVHAVHDEHSDSFWNTVGALVPDYEDRREWLRLNGNTLAV